MVIDWKRRMLHLRDELDRLGHDAVEYARLHSLSSRVLFARSMPSPNGLANHFAELARRCLYFTELALSAAA